MVDFEKALRDMQERRALPPAERAYLDEKERFESNVGHIVRDEAIRDAHSHDVRVVTLADRAYDRHVQGFKDVTGEYRSDNVISASYHDDGHALVDTKEDYAALKRIMHYESEGDRLSEEMGIGDRLDPIVRAMDAGAVVTVAGRDIDRSWRDSDGAKHTVTEFHAMRIALGERTLQQLVTPELGSLTDAALRHNAAKDQDAKDSITRAFLSQPHVAHRIAKLTERYERQDAAKATETGAKGPAKQSDDIGIAAARSASNER